MTSLLWRPQIPLSIDEEPLAITISDLIDVVNFPYDRLPQNSIIAFFLKPLTPIILVIAYLVAESILLPKLCRSTGVTGKSTIWKIVFATHNLVLAVFSFVVWINSWPIVIEHIFNNGVVNTLCDKNGSLWGPAGLGGWATIFYISKYYEFLDTFVLIVKNKKPSFLQVYHHSGVAITMWMAIVSQGAWVLNAVILNSGIHALMYTYFFLKTIKPDMEIKQAKYLTTAQILQFFTGIACTLPLLIMGDNCDSTASRMAAASLITYGVGLIYLFIVFASKKYKKKSN